MALSKDKLVAGDVVLVRWEPGWHSAIAVPRPAQAQTGVYLAHCKGPGSGTVIEEFDTVIKDSQPVDRHGYRRADPTGVSALAADYAVGWSTIPTQQQAFSSAYGSYPKNADVSNASRAMGVVRAIGTNPPFEYDALYRVFKWAQRADTHKVFSQNRGTTCCAFVMACHQSARIYKFFQGLNRLDLIPKIQEALLKNRGKEKELENPKELEGKTFYPGQALRDNSNLGMKDGTVKTQLAQHGIEWFWTQLGKQLSVYWDDSLNTIFGAALLHDPKFVHSQDFITYLQADNVWAAV